MQQTTISLKQLQQKYKTRVGGLCPLKEDSTVTYNTFLKQNPALISLIKVQSRPPKTSQGTKRQPVYLKSNTIYSNFSQALNKKKTIDLDKWKKPEAVNNNYATV